MSYDPGAATVTRAKKGEFKARYRGPCPVCNGTIPKGRLIKMLPEVLVHCVDTPDRHGPHGGDHCIVGSHYYHSLRGGYTRYHNPPSPSKAVHRQCYDKGVEQLELIRVGGRFAPYTTMMERVGTKQRQEKEESEEKKAAKEKSDGEELSVCQAEAAVEVTDESQPVAERMQPL
ncbi:hypothetical protein LCGC14_1781050 [marine sediment metagenome]|uniref:Uncharacterized protein n=1 Tax=marine sediment metagenome TaxID=412755 RepID=A0A0F9JAE6_9ZZZZ